MGIPKMDDLYGKTLLKWMIWRYLLSTPKAVWARLQATSRHLCHLWHLRLRHVHIPPALAQKPGAAWARLAQHGLHQIIGFPWLPGRADFFFRLQVFTVHTTGG